MFGLKFNKYMSNYPRDTTGWTFKWDNLAWIELIDSYYFNET